MDDISNKTLATLLIAAIVITLGGTIISINRLSQVPKAKISGRASTDTGTAEVTIQSSVSIVLQSNTVNFGTGYVNGSNAACASSPDVNISTDGSGGTNANDCWINASDDSVWSNSNGNWFDVENDGTVNVSVDIFGPTNVSFFSGQEHSDSSVNQLLWQVRDAVNCHSNNASDWIAFDTNSTLCGDLPAFPDASDNITVDVLVRFPYDQDATTYTNSSITFQAFQI
ncbi:hypothetical protein GF327_10140 [Candidatus Woesearchaeota archaeon]|nr:hypothetical protein [Candidatus Woesearchaeota archaeon]